MLEHQDNQDHQVNLDHQEHQDNLDQMDHQVNQDHQETMDTQVNQDHQVNQVDKEKKESVQNIVLSMEESSSKMDLAVKFFTNFKPFFYFFSIQQSSLLLFKNRSF